MMSVHVEVLPHLHRTVHAIKALGVKAGVVLNPATPVVALEEIAGDVDFVLVMSVNPGFGGQTFIPRSESKVREVRALLDRGRQPGADRNRRRHRPAQHRAASSPPARASSSPARRFSTRPIPSAPPASSRPPRSAPSAAGSPGERSDRPSRGCACATPKPTRWASSTTRTISSGSKSAAPICCATPAGPIARWKPKAFGLPVIEAHCDLPRVGEVRRRHRDADDGRAAVAGAGASSATRWSAPADAATLATGTTVHATLDRDGRPCRLPDRVQERCCREGARHRRRRLHRIDARRATARRRRRRRRHRLLHRLLSAADQGAQSQRRARRSRASASSNRAIQDADLRGAAAPIARTSSIWPRRPACGRAGAAISPIYTVNNIEATQVLLEAACDDAGARAPRLRVELVGLRRSRRDADARGRAAAAGVAVRRRRSWRPNSSAISISPTSACPTVSLRYFTVYGPRQRPDMGVSQVPARDDRGRADHRLRRRRADARLHLRRRRRQRERRSRPTRGVPGRVYNIGGGSRVSVNDVLEMIGRVTGRRPRDQRRSGAEGRHAAHLRRHVARAGGPGLRAHRRPRRGARGRVSVADWNTVIQDRLVPTPSASLRCRCCACARGRVRVAARAAPCRPARPSPTSSCSTKAPTRSTPRSGWRRASTSSRSPKPTPQSPYRPDAKLGHRRHLPRRRHVRSARPRDQRVHASSSRSTRPTAAPTTRSTSSAWRTSGRCALPQRDQTETRAAIKEFETFVARYPNSSLMPEAKAQAARGARSAERGRLPGRATSTTVSSGTRARSIASRRCSRTIPEFTNRDSVYFYLAESLVKVKREAEALPYSRSWCRSSRRASTSSMAQKMIDRAEGAGEAATKSYGRPCRSHATLRVVARDARGVAAAGALRAATGDALSPLADRGRLRAAAVARRRARRTRCASSARRTPVRATCSANRDLLVVSGGSARRRAARPAVLHPPHRHRSATAAPRAAPRPLGWVRVVAVNDSTAIAHRRSRLRRHRRRRLSRAVRHARACRPTPSADDDPPASPISRTLGRIVVGNEDRESGGRRRDFMLIDWGANQGAGGRRALRHLSRHRRQRRCRSRASAKAS